MGARVEVEGDRIRVHGGELVGTEIDLNATPDALPMLAAVGCFARGMTRLANCPQARIKETDRIEAMGAELTKMGARVRELPDGLEVHESTLSGADVDGRGDHRIVMALAVAGLAASGSSETVIASAEAAAVTFPSFASDMAALGGRIRAVSDQPSAVSRASRADR
jgi:3-phosphoshikimate 1-carboxyvinyltransferase